MPTAGGLYWWTHYFAGERYKRPLSFLIGYSNTLGLIGGICSVDCEFVHSFIYHGVDSSRYIVSDDSVMRFYLRKLGLVRLTRSHLRSLRRVDSPAWNFGRLDRATYAEDSDCMHLH
jgi:hypothetical protein